MTISPNIHAKAKLLGSLLLFTQYFYKLRTGHEFLIHEPIGRQPRQYILCKEFTHVFRNPSTNLAINIHPGSGKSELCIHFIAWALAHYPDSNFLFISHSKSLAERHTSTLRNILTLPQYQQLFGVTLRDDSKAKGHFTTIRGGAVMAFGSSGAVTGNDAGRPNLTRFSGAIIIDDIHNPNDVYSDLKRNNVIRNYYETIYPRKRGENVPIIAIGQRLHESDLPGEIAKDREGHKWRKVILPTLDEAGNNLSPDIISTEELLNMQKISNYVFSSQYQQNPQPAGGALFKKEWFKVIDTTPKMLSTFIVADTAETNKNYNDATVFSFFGIYEIMQGDISSGILGLHWIDCAEMWVEPRELENEFLNFYRQCLQFEVKPQLAAIEKKSTGTTLISLLNDFPGLKILDIERSAASGSKASRFLEIQPFVAAKRITFTRERRHISTCIDHMSKITANDSHRFDDIADTLADGIKLALVDKISLLGHNSKNRENLALNKISQFNKRMKRPTHQSWLK